MTDRSLRVLLLGGTTEATELAASMRNDGTAAVLSFAGRTRRPGVGKSGSKGVGDGGGSVAVRIGGFGAAAGLAAYIRDESISAVVCATHPFAAQMPWNAVAACAETGTPLIRILRPAWSPSDGDRWVAASDIDHSAQLLDELGARRVLLTTGRQQLAPFEAIPNVRFVIRSIEPPNVSRFVDAIVVLDRGPFTVHGEVTLMQRHGIDTLVTKNSGGSSTEPKLEAARLLGLRVVVIDRPPSPAITTVSSVAAVQKWLASIAQESGNG